MRLAPILAATVALMLSAGCTTPETLEFQVVKTTEDRITEVSAENEETGFRQAFAVSDGTSPSSFSVSLAREPLTASSTGIVKFAVRRTNALGTNVGSSFNIDVTEMDLVIFGIYFDDSGATFVQPITNEALNKGLSTGLPFDAFSLLLE